MKTYLIKKISEISEKDLFEFYSKAFSNIKNSFITNYKWRYRLGYNDFEPIVIIVENKIIGHAGLIPVEINNKGRNFSAIWFVDFIILPEYQSKGYGKKLTEEWMQICSNQITYCNELSLRVFKKLNWINNFSIQRKIYPINFFKIVPFLKKIELNFANKLYRSFLKKRLNKNEKINIYKISEQIIKNCVFSEKNLDKFGPNILRDEDWFKWRLLECPYKNDLVYFEDKNEFVVGHIFLQDKIKRLNIIYNNAVNSNSQIFNKVIGWSLENQIDFLWYITAKSSNSNKLFSSVLKKPLNFAYNTNDQSLLNDLSKGLLNTSGIDSDIDYV